MSIAYESNDGKRNPVRHLVVVVVPEIHSRLSPNQHLVSSSPVYIGYLLVANIHKHLEVTNVRTLQVIGVPEAKQKFIISMLINIGEKGGGKYLFRLPITFFHFNNLVPK